jgi:hypothetical protein
MAKTFDSRIPCTTETRKLVKAQKRGGESYDDLLQKMVEQYDPEEAHENPLSDVGERGKA